MFHKQCSVEPVSQQFCARMGVQKVAHTSNRDCQNLTQRRIMEMCLPILSRHPPVAVFFLHGFCVAVKLSALEITCQNLY